MKRITAAVDDWMEKSVGGPPAGELAKRIAKKHHVSVDSLKTAILKQGLKDGWLQDEYFR